MECDPGTLYDGVALCTVIENDRGTPPQDGDLTAAIRYRTPYTTLKRNYVVLSFGICDNVAVNTIIGLPALNVFEAMVYLQHNKLNCKVISQIVSLYFDGLSRKFPTSVSYDSSSFNTISSSSPS